MALDPLSLVFGGLLGGGDETNTTVSNETGITFNPSIAISLGGGVTSTPQGSLTQTPTATTTSNDQQGGLPTLGGLLTSSGGAEPIPISTAGLGGGMSSTVKLALVAMVGLGGWYYLKG